MRKLVATVAAASLLTLTACSEPKPEVRIAADPSNPEQMVLAEIYRQVVELDGRQVGIIPVDLPDDNAKLGILQVGDANLAVLCVGSLVVQGNPGESQQLIDAAKQHSATPNGAAPAEGESDEGSIDLPLATYDAAVGTLPANLKTIDPSPAEGCMDQEHGDLPNNIIPVFQAGIFDRGVKRAMGQATRALSTDDLEELVEKSKADSDPAPAVNEWLMEKTGMGAELRRIVDEGEAREA